MSDDTRNSGHGQVRRIIDSLRDSLDPALARLLAALEKDADLAALGKAVAAESVGGDEHTRGRVCSNAAETAVHGDKNISDGDVSGASASGVARWQDDLIVGEIPPGASVLDLGCGRGELLSRLIAEKNVRAQGVELDPEAVMDCVRRGVPVFNTDLDAGFSGFADGSFDFVILEETLQTLHKPLRVLAEMLRVGRRGIVSFPNFAYWRVRLDLALLGRMPVTSKLPYSWHETPNIHLFTLRDFFDWAEGAGVLVAKGYALADGGARELEPDDNLHAREALLVVEKEEPLPATGTLLPGQRGSAKLMPPPVR